jgi:hypothetical protein
VLADWGRGGIDPGKGNRVTAVGWRGGESRSGERDSMHHSLCAASMVSFGLLGWWAFFVEKIVACSHS